MAATNRFCDKCGAAIPSAESRYCTSCGAEVASSADIPAPTVQPPVRPQSERPSPTPPSPIPMDPRTRGFLQTLYYGNPSKRQAIGILGLIIGIVLVVGLISSLTSSSESSSSIEQDPESPACLQAKGLRDSLPPEAKEYAPLQYYEAERWVRMNCDN